ncbi:MAG: NAD(P)-dependent oxidoreductase [Planctomycetota bacterium]|jgi:3-hydroxyisobutyrate dehydrogenase|nr:NAD(P)-dependent oxidoreductase [Planctomycetota bacterium]
MNIGFIGLGVMGASMAGHLLAAGHRLGITTRTASKAQGLLDQGAHWYPTPAALVTDCEVVFTIVGYPQDVEAVYFGSDGLMSALQAGQILVDMTTSSPELAIRIATATEERLALALDAPVSGGDKGAREAALSIMVGGDAKAFETIKPLFDLMGKNIVYQGPAGSGQHCKLCNQIAIASNMLGVCEALAYAKRSGLDPHLVLSSISTGAAGSWSLSNLAPRILDGDFEPGFFIKHFIKDMKLAVESAQSLGFDAPGLSLALKQYQSAAQQGLENAGTQALFRVYTKQED